MDTTKQQETAAFFRSWFTGGNSHNRSWFTGGNSHNSQSVSVKTTIEANRARYRMILPDAAERIELGLSALPSTKSCSIVDNAVVDAIQEYYATDAITFTADDDGDTNKDHLAAWLTELFHLRAKKNGFWVWHLQSLKAGLVDGIEAGMVRWRKESYEYADNHYFYRPTGAEISEKEYKAARKSYPMFAEGAFDPSKGRPSRIKIKFNDHYEAVREKKSRTVADTWECVQLKPGENLLWDFKNPLLDLNRGQWCIVILQMQAEDIMSMSKAGIFDKITLEEMKPYLTSGTSVSNGDYTDYTSSATDPDTVDAGSFNTAEVWLAFERKNCQWMVSFSLKGEKELKGDESVNDVFFGGRPFDRLPVVMGASDIELWEAIGRGIPKLIAPIEDELTDHRNNLNDMSKQASTGKYWVDEQSDVNINALLNDKVFFAKPGDVVKLDFGAEMQTVMRASDMVGSDIASLAPVNMSDNSLVGRGNAKDTLGSVQLAVGGNDKKLGARLLVRNITFFNEILRVIAEMHMAFETSQSIGRIAGKNAKLDMGQLTTVVDGKPSIDFSLLDFDVDVTCNAGLGNVPKQQKVQRLLQWEAWASAKGLPVDMLEVDKQIKVLNGFNEDQFLLPEEKRGEKPPPPVEDKLNLSVTFTELLQYAPDAAQALLQKALSGAMQMTTNVKQEKSPNYLKADMGSPSQPLAQRQMANDQPQGQMG
jgi:hypothetical protein